MLPNKANLPLTFETINAIGRGLEKAHLNPIRLDADILCLSAMKQTGLMDFGYDYFQEGLYRLVDSLLRDANLHYFGKIITQRVILNYLTQRLLFAEYKKTKGEGNTHLNSPIFVTGIPRSGTTFLHRMLSLDQQNENVPFWRLYRPFPHPNKNDNRRKIARQEINLRRPAYPEMDTKHFIREDEGEECIWMTGITLSSIVFWVLAPVASYAKWIFQQDRHFYYKEYRELLQAQQQYYPTKSLVLKAPDHTPNVDVLLAEIPDARIIQLHRDPTTCLTSLNSLFYSTHKSVSTDLNPQRIGEINQLMYFHYLNRNEAAKKTINLSNSVFDVQYQQLVGNPLDTVKLIYQHFGIPFSEEFEQQLNSYVNQNKKNRYGKHNYGPEQFGQNKEELQQFFQHFFPNEVIKC